jgi:hypothetical protein
MKAADPATREPTGASSPWDRQTCRDTGKWWFRGRTGSRSRAVGLFRLGFLLVLNILSNSSPGQRGEKSHLVSLLQPGIEFIR